jgi:hypothetical protein
MPCSSAASPRGDGCGGDGLADRRGASMNHRITVTSAIGAVLLGAALTGQQPLYVSLKAMTEHPPLPVEGVVTATLASGAWIKLRATDIDYERTSAYKNRIVVRAERQNEAPDHKSVTLVFLNGKFIAPVWKSDLDLEEMNAGFPGFLKYQRAQPGVTMANFQKLHEGMTESEVFRIFGGGADEKASSRYGEQSSVMYEWTARDGHGVVVVMFRDGVMSSKSQYGLW